MCLLFRLCLPERADLIEKLRGFQPGHRGLRGGKLHGEARRRQRGHGVLRPRGDSLLRLLREYRLRVRLRKLHQPLHHDGGLRVRQRVGRTEEHACFRCCAGDDAAAEGGDDIRTHPLRRVRFIGEAGGQRGFLWRAVEQMHRHNQKFSAPDGFVWRKAEMSGDRPAGVGALFPEPDAQILRVLVKIAVDGAVGRLNDLDLDAGLVRYVSGGIGGGKDEAVLADLVFLRRVGEGTVLVQLYGTALGRADERVGQRVAVRIGDLERPAVRDVFIGLERAVRRCGRLIFPVEKGNAKLARHTDAVGIDWAVVERALCLRVGDRLHTELLQRSGGQNIPGADAPCAVADGADGGRGDGGNKDAAQGGGVLTERLL